MLNCLSGLPQMAFGQPTRDPTGSNVSETIHRARRRFGRVVHLHDRIGTEQQRGVIY